MDDVNYERPFWQQRELEKMLETLRPLSAAVLPPSFAAQIRALETLSERFTLPPPYLKAFESIQNSLMMRPIFEDTFTKLASVHQATSNAFSAIEKSMAELAIATPRVQSDIALAVRTVSESLVSAEALLRIGRVPDALLGLELRPHVAFEAFASARLTMAKVASEAFRVNTVSVLSEAAGLLSQMARGPELASLLVPPTPELLPLPEVNVFTVLGRRLAKVDLEIEGLDTDEVTVVPPLRDAINLGTRLLELVYNLNIEAEHEGRDAPFKPTTKAMRAFHVISTHLADDESSFGEVIDSLYFLLYEGSGEAKRLLERVPDDRLSALWQLKHLRLGLRHDVDHGTDAEFREKAGKVGKAYLALIQGSTPHSGEEWCLAQVQLYRGLVDLLEALWRR